MTQGEKTHNKNANTHTTHTNSHHHIILNIETDFWYFWKLSFAEKTAIDRNEKMKRFVIIQKRNRCSRKHQSLLFFFFA